MKRAISALIFMVGMLSATGAWAQQSYWIQLEANATLATAEAATREYAERLDNVNGFRLGVSGWYSAALGPFTEADAEARLRDLLAQGAVPRDAYVSDGSAYGAQFWPVGAETLTQAPVEPQEVAEAPVQADEAPAEEAPAEDAPVVAEVAPEPEPEPEETRAEALRSERDLDRAAREEIQTILQWEGFYDSGIDGAFGPGTRASMAAWQASRGHEETGVLTTRQRAQLVNEYQEVIDSLGLASVTDQDAGIEVIMPTAEVSFDRYEAPFAHYEGEGGARVVLISQSGGQSTLYGLYDILQSLEVVPTEGERTRAGNSFTINGVDDKIVSYTYATVADGAVKGFMLVWPKGDEKRHEMVLSAMRDSFTSTGEAVLADDAGLDQSMQSVDLVSGLEIRRADRARTGFYVTGNGMVLTTTEAIQGCGQITLDESYPAKVVASDAGLGVALLQPEQALAPLAHATFSGLEPRIQSDVAVAGYSFGGRLSSATLTFGKLADIKGLGGEDSVYRLELEAQDGDAGGAVIDRTGQVLGLLQSDALDPGRTFPDEVSFAAKAPVLADFLTANGVAAEAATSSSELTPHALAVKASDMSVLVSCWN